MGGAVYLNSASRHSHFTIEAETLAEGAQGVSDAELILV